VSSNSMLDKGSPGTGSLDDFSPGNPNARQVGGTHYQGEYQHWDYATDLKMRHLEGSATKYLSRAGNKTGEPRVKDLEKVAHYLEKLLEVFRDKRLCPLRPALSPAP
jgi:hypothetical protein